MKKGLSILLIVAALFGFYGGAVNLQDVLACMKYWEKEGEKSTADMNKLEDGLKQLQDNEQAYLDGQVQLADGEKALADAEIQLADGRATLAEGEAAYAAAPGQLAEGRESLNDLEKLISGLNKAYKSFNNYSVDKKGNKGPSWKQGFEHTVSSAVLAKIAAGEKTSDSPGLRQAKQVITSTVNEKKGMLDAAAGLGGMTSSLSGKILGAKSYAQFDSAVSSGVKPLAAAATKLNGLSAAASGAVAAKADDFAKAKGALALDEDTRKGMVGQLKALQVGLNSLNVPDSTTMTQLRAKAEAEQDQTKKEQLLGIVNNVEKMGLGNTVGEAKANVNAGIELYSDPQGVVAAGINQAINALGGASSLEMVNSLDSDLYKSLKQNLGILTRQVTVPDSIFSETIDKFAADMMKLSSALADAAKTAQTTSDTFKSWHEGYDQLKDGQDQLADTSSGIPYAFRNMRTNKTLKAAIKSSSPSLYKALNKYTGSRLKNDDMDDFDSDMAEVSSLIKKAMPILNKVRAKGQKDYKQGLADYAAAPGKLAAGRKALADGEAQYADGVQQLEDGKKQLAQYEDGEQQVRDGLATLMSTEPSGGLESILDRRNGDDDFDNGDEHLDLAEGLEAVDVGRGYQADSGDLITAELVKRGAGTAAGIAAGVLALLAALLSFLKKNKGAAISGCIAAIAAAGGAAVGTSAGTEFSAQAGSTVGMLPWAAAGILAGIAVVFAIVHFSNPKEAK